VKLLSHSEPHLWTCQARREGTSGRHQGAPDEGGFERPKPQTLFQAMMSSVKPGTIPGQVRQLAAATNQLTQLPQPSTLPVASPSHAASTAHS